MKQIQLTDREKKLLRAALSSAIWRELNHQSGKSITESIKSLKTVSQYEALKSKIAGL